MKNNKKVDWFLCGMFCVVLLAWLFPSPGAQGGWLYPVILTKIGIALIFFLHGVSLAFSSLKDGIKAWKLHLVVQITTFLLFPLIGFVILFEIHDTLPLDLQIGIFFLCALPSTVSSSVALTAAAKGNIGAAIFNATLSSLLGIFLTPLWITARFHETHTLLVGDIIADLIQWLLLPLIIGQIARPLLKNWAQSHKPLIAKIDRGTILLLVYTSFCDSVVWGVWNNDSINLFTVLMLVFLLLGIILCLTRLLCSIFGFARSDMIATVFCGSKKSLAQGVPIAQVMFAGNPAIGMILLPIMLYHPLQLLICGVLAGRWAKNVKSEAYASE